MYRKKNVERWTQKQEKSTSSVTEMKLRDIACGTSMTTKLRWQETSFSLEKSVERSHWENAMTRYSLARITIRVHTKIQTATSSQYKMKRNCKPNRRRMKKRLDRIYRMSRLNLKTQRKEQTLTQSKSAMK